MAVGSAGLVVQSSDSGQTWNTVTPFTEAALLDVSCDGEFNLIVGQEGSIFRQEGNQYRAIDSGTDARLLGVDENADGLAFAVGGFGTVLRSTDGGQSWEPLSFDWEAILNDYVEPHLYAVDVSPEGVVTLVGEFELVLRSTDGGTTWDAVHKGEASLLGIDLRADGVGFAVGQNGVVLQTTDGGLTWSTLPVPTEAILLDAWSSAQGDILISGIRTVLHSTDGGVGWQSLTGGDINVGWYESLEVQEASAGSPVSATLAGNQGSIIKLQLN